MFRGRHPRGATLDEIEAVYTKHVFALRRVAAAIIGDVELAADAVQDAFGEAIRSRASFRGTGPLEGWLWRAVVNRARDIARRRARDSMRPQSPVSPQNGSAQPDAAVRALVASLPERQRLAIFLRYYAGLDYEGIAAALGVKPGTVAAALSAAHKTVRQRLEEVPK